MTTSGTTPKGTTSAPEQGPAPGGGKRKVGGQAGNLNAGKHGAYLDEVKRGVRASRDRHRRKAEAEALAILRAAGQEDNPLAKLVARQMRRLETVASRVESYLEARGYFNGKGDPKPAVAQLVQTTDKLLGEARRMLEVIVGQGSSPDDSTLGAAMDALERRERESAPKAGAPPLDPVATAATTGVPESTPDQLDQVATWVAPRDEK